MHARTICKFITLAAATLATLALSGPAQAAAPAARAVPVGQSVLAVSQVTGNFLLPDDTKGDPGTYLKVYPTQQPTWNDQWQFDVVAYSNNRPVYQLKSSPGGACATDEGRPDNLSFLRACNRGNKGQWWLLQPVPGTDPENPDYGIVSYVHEDLALTARSEGDNYVDLKPMLGGSPSARQGWHFYPA